MPRPVRFRVTKWSTNWLVTGRVSVGGKIGVEDYRQVFGTRKAADIEAARMAQIEEAARARIAEDRAARKIAAKAKREQRERRKAAMGVQLSLFA